MLLLMMVLLEGKGKVLIVVRGREESQRLCDVGDVDVVDETAVERGKVEGSREVAASTAASTADASTAAAASTIEVAVVELMNKSDGLELGNGLNVLGLSGRRRHGLTSADDDAVKVAGRLIVPQSAAEMSVDPS